ncbi:hypothetical protein ELBR111191_18500 [Elizabethkingia bruuniana]
MQGLQYMTLNLREFVLRNATQYNYRAKNTMIYETKKPYSMNKAFSVLQI